MAGFFRGLRDYETAGYCGILRDIAGDARVIFAGAVSLPRRLVGSLPRRSQPFSAVLSRSQSIARLNLARDQLLAPTLASLPPRTTERTNKRTPRSLVRSFARSLVRPFARSPVRLFARSPVRSFARSPTHTQKKVKKFN